MSATWVALYDGVPGQIRLEQFSTPKPNPGEMLVAVEGCTLCGSDLHTQSGRREVVVPTILGHEIVGRIESLGSCAPPRDLRGDELKIGDRITWAIVASCGQCFYCHRGLTQKCLAGIKYGHELFGDGKGFVGGLSEHCLLSPQTSIVRLDERLPLAVVCPASCATATVAACLQACGELKGKSVLIAGAGMLGLTACAMSCEGGAESVLCMDRSPDRLELATRFGASACASTDSLASTVAELTAGRGVDVAMDFTGSTQAIAQLVPRIGIGGSLILVGSVFPDKALELLPEQVVRRLLRIVGVHNYAPQNLLQAIQFLEDCHARYPFADLVARWYPLTQVAKAFQAAHDAGCIRIGVGLNQSVASS